MANYSLVVNSQFRPFSYAELTAPLDRQELYHEKLAEEYDNLSKQADVLSIMGGNDLDKNSSSYSKYKNYSDSLKKEADDLFSFGLNTESRRRLSDLRRRFNTDIRPIQTAWVKREQEADDQMKAYLQNPTLMFTRDAAKTRIDDYIANPNGGYGVINGATITAQMATMAKNLAKQIRSGRRENIDEFTYNYIQKYGLDENIIRNWQDSPTLKAMFEQVMKANGVTPEALQGSLNADSIISQSTNYAEMGMWHAMGEDKTQIVDAFGPRLAAQEASQKRLKQYEASLTAPPTETGLPGETIPIMFGDKEGAGNSLKQAMADVTWNTIQSSKRPEAKRIRDYWAMHGGKEAAIERWTTEGLNGGKNIGQLYYDIGNAIRKNVTKNESLINVWRSGYVESSNPINTKKLDFKSSVRKSDAAVKPNSRKAFEHALERIDALGLGFREPKRPNVGFDAKINSGGTKQYKKDWGKFNDMAHTGYKLKAIQLKDDPTLLGHYLGRIMDRNSHQDGTYNLYDIKRVKADGTYEYKPERAKPSELPLTGSAGQERVDWSRVSRARLSNGDYLLYWTDNKNVGHRKVLKRSDIGENAVRDWELTSAGYQHVNSLYNRGLITEEQYEGYLKGIGMDSMQDSYLDTQEAKVNDYEIEE